MKFIFLVFVFLAFGATQSVNAQEKTKKSVEKVENKATSKTLIKVNSSDKLNANYDQKIKAGREDIRLKREKLEKAKKAGKITNEKAKVIEDRLANEEKRLDVMSHKLKMKQATDKNKFKEKSKSK